jgi:hypothetical protein
LGELKSDRLRASAHNTGICQPISLFWEPKSPLGEPMSLFWELKSPLGELKSLFWEPKSPLGEPMSLFWEPKSPLGEPISLFWVLLSLLALGNLEPLLSSKSPRMGDLEGGSRGNLSQFS